MVVSWTDLNDGAESVQISRQVRAVTIIRQVYLSESWTLKTRSSQRADGEAAAHSLLTMRLIFEVLALELLHV